MRDVRVQAEDFDPGAELARLEALGGGGVASFIGIVRGVGELTALVLEQYPAMTEKALSAIVAEAEARWPLLGVVIIHRVGTLVPGDRIVLVGTVAMHRAAALEACAFLIDWPKTKAPFWKQERFADGPATWVEPRAGDDAAAEKWR